MGTRKITGFQDFFQHFLIVMMEMLTSNFCTIRAETESQ